MRFSAATSGTQHRGSKPLISSSTWASVTPKLGIKVVNYSAEEWVIGDVYTNPIEGVWSPFKRSVIGTFHKDARHRSFREFRLLLPSCLKHPPTDNRHKTEDYSAD